MTVKVSHITHIDNLANILGRVAYGQTQKHIDELDITRIIQERHWSDFKEEKQAEFLAFNSVEWQIIQQIAVKTQVITDEVTKLFLTVAHKPDAIINTVKTSHY